MKGPFWLRTHVAGAMVIALKPTTESPLAACGYSNRLRNQTCDECLPGADTIQGRLRDAGVWTPGSERGPDVIWWAVNSPLSERLTEEPGRRVFRLLDAADGAPMWHPLAEAGELSLRELEEQHRWEETREERERRESESAAILRDGFLLVESPEGWTYRDRELVLTETPPAMGTAGLDPGPWVPVVLPREDDGTGMIVRPWRIWVGEDSWWRPEYDAWLTPERRSGIADRLARHDPRVRIDARLPSESAPLAIPAVSMAWVRGILELLVQQGLSLNGLVANPRYPGASDPTAVFRGPSAPRKWYQTQGGEWNAHLAAPVPDRYLSRVFRWPDGRDREQGGISVSPEKLEAFGGDLWVAYIWGSDR